MHIIEGHDDVVCPFCESMMHTKELANDVHYCGGCRVVFHEGCLHVQHTDPKNVRASQLVRNAHVIVRYTYDCVVYKGMPLFSTYDEARTLLASSVIVLEWACLNQPKQCALANEGSSTGTDACRLTFADDVKGITIK